jgi:hypothetical protein
MTTQPVATGRFWARLLDRARFTQAADWMAVAVAASLPWSTSLSGILIVIWLLCLIPTLDLRSLRWAVADGMAFLCAARQRLSGRSNQGLHHPER